MENGHPIYQQSYKVHFTKGTTPKHNTMQVPISGQNCHLCSPHISDVLEELWKQGLIIPYTMELPTPDHILDRGTQIAKPPLPDLALLNSNIKSLPYQFHKVVTHIILTARQNMTKFPQSHV